VKYACDYLMVPFNGDTVRADNVAQLMHELANDGAQHQFQQFFDSIIFREMIALAHKGERECHILVLMEDDSVDWDLEYPPPKTDDDEAQIIRNDRLCRFLKYLENREQAKFVLKDRGLKKIKLGIEGFPTQMEKLKTSTRGGGKPEVVYNYIQRPLSTCLGKRRKRGQDMSISNVLLLIFPQTWSRRPVTQTLTRQIC
jgi:BTB/POZ domain-containing protein 10